jgi:Protein of unknown function (DUF4232)
LESKTSWPCQRTQVNEMREPTMERLYRIIAIVVVVAAVGVGAYFAGRETAPTTSAPTTTTTVQPTTTTVRPTTTTTEAPTTTTVSGVCQPSQLHIAQAGSGGAMGTNERTFSLTNTSSATCTLYGYPGLLLRGPGGIPEQTNAVRGGGLSFESVEPSTVKLSPGDVAYFNIGYSDVTTVNTTCSTATAIQIIPPTDTAHAVVTVSPHILACDNGTLHESAVFSSTDTAATKTTAPS